MEGKRTLGGSTICTCKGMSVWFPNQDNKGDSTCCRSRNSLLLSRDKWMQRTQAAVISSSMVLTKTLRVAMVGKKILKIAMLQHLGSIDVWIRYRIDLSGIN